MSGTTLRGKSLDTCYFIIQDDASPPPMEDGSAPSGGPGIILYVLCPSGGPRHARCNGRAGTKAARTDRINNLNPGFASISNDPEITKHAGSLRRYSNLPGCSGMRH